MILFSLQIPITTKKQIISDVSIDVQNTEDYSADVQTALNNLPEHFKEIYGLRVMHDGFVSMGYRINQNQESPESYYRKIWSNTTSRNQFINVIDGLFQKSSNFGIKKTNMEGLSNPLNRPNMNAEEYLNKITSNVFNESWELTKHALLKSFLAHEDIIAIVNPLSRFLNQKDPIQLRWSNRRDTYQQVVDNYNQETCFKDLTTLYKMKKMSFKHNDLDVFSFIPEDLLSEFNYYHTVDDYKFLCSKQNEPLTKRTNHRANFTELSQNNLISCDTQLMSEITHDFQEPIKMLRLDKFLSSKADQEWSFEEAPTKKSFLKRPGTVIPCLYKQQVMTLKPDGSIDHREAYVACLLVNITFERMKKYTAPLIYLKKLYKQASSYEIVKYVNFEKYKQYLQNANLTFTQYSFANTQNYETLAQIIGTLPPEENLKFPKPLSIDHLHSFVIQPYVDIDLEKKKRKLTTRYNRAKDTIENFKTSTTSLTNEISTFNNNIQNRVNAIKSWESYIQDAKERIAQQETLITANIEKIKAIYSSYANTYDSYDAIKQQYRSFNKQYSDTLQKNLEEKNYQVPPFFASYDTSDYQIISIKFDYKADSSKEKTTITLDNNIESFVKDFSKEINIKEVVFQTTKPFKIIPDNKPSKAVVGGPWICRVTSNNLYIKLKDQSSFFGVSIQRSRMQVHPHASKNPLNSHSDYVRAFTKYENACLGEAQPLIYNAFEKNDLSLIIMACSVWLKSANSTDVWGKHYQEFLPWTEYESAINNILLPTEEEIEISLETHQMQPQEYINQSESTQFVSEPTIHPDPSEPSTPSTEVEYVWNGTEITTENQQEELNPLPTTNNTVSLPQEEQTNSQPVYVRYTPPIS